MSNGDTQVRVAEDTIFARDTASTPRTVNRKLADLLLGDWRKLNVVSIKRITIGDSGWEATYRE